jgi:hypothetical protein
MTKNVSVLDSCDNPNRQRSNTNSTEASPKYCLFEKLIGDVQRIWRIYLSLYPTLQCLNWLIPIISYEPLAFSYCLFCLRYFTKFHSTKGIMNRHLHNYQLVTCCLQLPISWTESKSRESLATMWLTATRE